MQLLFFLGNRCFHSPHSASSLTSCFVTHLCSCSLVCSYMHSLERLPWCCPFILFFTFLLNYFCLWCIQSFMVKKPFSHFASEFHFFFFFPFKSCHNVFVVFVFSRGGQYLYYFLRQACDMKWVKCLLGGWGSGKSSGQSAKWTENRTPHNVGTCPRLVWMPNSLGSPLRLPEAKSR